jgi:hypothetical protein
MGRNADKPPKNVLKLIAKHQKPLPPIPPPPTNVIPAASLWNRFRSRRKGK